MRSSLQTTLIAGAAALLLAGGARSLLLVRPKPPRYLPFNHVTKKGVLRVGAPPPPFRVTDTAGRTLDLNDYKGRVVLLDFWATWCPACRAEFPELARTIRKYQDKGLTVIGVSLDTDRAKMDAYLRQRGADWPQYFDGREWENALVKSYGVDEIPFSLLIGTDGRIASIGDWGKGLDADIAYALRFKE